MLVLSRKPCEKVVVGDNIEVTVVQVHGNRVRLGIVAPDDVPVVRSEVMRSAEPQPSHRPHGAGV